MTPAERAEWRSWTSQASIAELLTQLSRTRAAMLEGKRQEAELMAELAIRRGKLAADKVKTQAKRTRRKRR
jgi:hypothetical protein